MLDESESAPFSLTTFTPPWGGLLPRANWPLRTRRWAEIAQRRVYPRPVVDDLDVLEQVQRRLLAGSVGLRMHALRLHDAHEQLHGGVVPRRWYRPHRRADAALAHGLGKRRRHVSGSVIAVMHAPIGRVSPGQSHLQRVVGQLGSDVRPHRPARYAARPYARREHRVQSALARLDVGDVGEPRHVRAVISLEPAPHRVRRRFAPRGPLLARGPFGARARPAPSAFAHDAGRACETCAPRAPAAA